MDPTANTAAPPATRPPGGLGDNPSLSDAVRYLAEADQPPGPSRANQAPFQAEASGPDQADRGSTGDTPPGPDDAGDLAEQDPQQTDQPGGDETDPVLFQADDGTPVTRSQVEEWRKGHLRQEDYTRKTQEIAERRKALAEHETNITRGRDVLAATLETYNGFMQAQRDALIRSIPAEPAPELLATDPVSFVAQERQRNAALVQLHQFDQQVNGIQHLARQAGEAAATVDEGARQAKAQAEFSKLLEKLPRWNDPTVAQTEGAETRKVLETAGFQPHEIIDHRLFELAYYAGIGRRAVESGRLGGLASAKSRQGAAGGQSGAPSFSKGQGFAPAAQHPRTRAVQEARTRMEQGGSRREREAAGIAYLSAMSR